MTSTRRTATTPVQAPGPGHVAHLGRSRPREAMEFDHARLAAVCDLHGHMAESYIASILDEIEDQIAVAADATQDDVLVQACDDLVTLSDAIGMRTMGRAARALGDVLRGGTGCAVAAEATREACLHRLLRLGRPAGTAGWEISGEGTPDTVA